MSSARRRIARATSLALLLVLASLTGATASEAPRWATQLPNELLSPFCPGVTLAECPSPQASSLKMWILVQAAAGRSEADVREELYGRYGDQIRPTPKAEGFGIAAYVMPVVVFLGGGGFVAWFLRRATRRSDAGRVVSELDPEVERKLDEVLGDRDEDEVDRR